MATINLSDVTATNLNEATATIAIANTAATNSKIETIIPNAIKYENDTVYLFDTDTTIATPGYTTNKTTISKPNYDYIGKTEYNILEERVAYLESEITKKQNIEPKKEKKNMEKNMFNLDFGPCSDKVRLSAYGIAIKNISGEWVSYDSKTENIINVDIFNLSEGGKFLYRIPVGISEIKVGDVVIHSRVPVFVKKIESDGSFSVIDIRDGEKKTILPTRSPFGFNFMIKIVNVLDMFGEKPSAEHPFGNMLPFLMMNNEGNQGMDTNTIAILMMMQSQNGCENMFSNPMMMYMMLNGEKKLDPIMLMMMNGMNAHNCGCKTCSCDSEAEKE